MGIYMAGHTVERQIGRSEQGNGRTIAQSVLDGIQRYLIELNERGIPTNRAVLYGSQAAGTAHEWSDVDLIVLSPLFDRPRERKHIDLLWRAAGDIDPRIEPIGVGERQWLEDKASAMIEIARRTGVMITLEPALPA